MRKAMTANKIAKRATAMILALVMVFGLTITVYAEEDTENEVIAEVAAVESAEATASTEAPAGEAPTEDNAGAAQLIDAAEAAVIADGLATDDSDAVVVLQVGQDVLEQLQAGDAAVEQTAADLAAAKAAMEAAVAADQAVTTYTAVVNAYNEAVEASETAAKNASDNAQIANDETVDEATAKAAAATAQTELATSGSKLDEAKAQYEAAAAALEEANTKQAEAQAQVEAAEAALSDAKTNSTAALAALNAAKAQVAALENRKNELEEIQDQYYRMMVHYYRDGKIASAVYNADGSLNLEDSAAKANATGKSVDPSNLSNNTLMISRELLKQLVTYKLIANGADADSIAFAEDGQYKKAAAEGDLVKDNKGNDRVTISTSYDQYWTSDQSGDSGRNHCAKVTYTKNGETVTEYYNYIFKASKYGDDTDLEKGPLFLALVKKNTTTNKWESERDYSANNYDDYQKLTAAVDALQNYEATKAAVEAAAAKVAELKAQAEALNNVEAKAQAAAALADLEDAKAAFEAAKAAVDAIDLSRFAVVPAQEADEADDEDGAASSTTIPVITSITAPIVITPAAPFAAFAAATGVAAGTAPAAGTVELTDAALPGAAAPAVAPATASAEETLATTEEILPVAEAEAPVALTTLTDGELPAAQFPETVAQLWWLWLLILLLAVIIAYCLYKYNECRKSEEA